MFQLTYASCRQGMSLNGSGGYTVRAASSQIDHAWIEHASQLARYDVGSSSKGQAGVRLAFLRHQKAAVIAHSSLVQDHNSRPSSFTHSIIDPTGQTGPCEAINMWGSSFWKIQDDESATELPMIESLPVNDALDWASLQHQLENKQFQAMAEFLLTAWLRRKNLPIVLQADAEQVAAAIWLLTRCLPASTLRDLSFTTHDHDPATAGVVVIGYCCTTKNLHASVLADRHWFDARTGKRSGDGMESYAKFACGEINAGRQHTVDHFIRLCAELDIDDTDSIDMLHRVVHKSHVCTVQEILQLHDRPRFLRWLLQNQRHGEIAVSILVSDVGCDLQAGKALVVAFSDTSERTQIIINSLLGQACAALAKRDLCRAAFIIDLCGATNESLDPSTFWRIAVEQVGIDRLAVATRLELAELLDELDAASERRHLVSRLLNVPIEDLPVLLQCTACAPLKAEACRIAMDRSGVMAYATLKALSSQQDVLAHLLHIAADPTGIASMIAAYEIDSVLQVLIDDSTLQSRIDLDAVIDHAIKSGQQDLRQLATINFAQYWKILLRGRHAKLIMNEIPWHAAKHDAKMEILRYLRAALGYASTTNAVAGVIRRRIALLEALVEPTIPIVMPEDVMAAIPDLPQSDRRTVTLKLLPRLITGIVNSETATIGRHLQQLIELAGSQAQRAPATVLREL